LSQYPLRPFRPQRRGPLRGSLRSGAAGRRGSPCSTWYPAGVAAMSVLPHPAPPPRGGREEEGPAPRRFWLFSAPVDLGVFLGSAALSFVALAVGAQLGLLHDATPDWAWIPAVVLIDVAHVWSTAFRVYFDPHELRRRSALYLLVPIIGYALGIALYSEGELLFWRGLAYLAGFHFVRPQYGWVATFPAPLRQPDPPGRR